MHESVDLHEVSVGSQSYLDDPAHPVLSSEILDRLQSYGQEMYSTGDSLLFSRGDRSLPLFIIQKGSLEVFEEDREGNRVVVATLGVGQFTGELNLWNDRACLVSCRVRQNSHLRVIDREGLGRLLRAYPMIADTLLRASMIRRSLLVRAGRAGVTVIGDKRAAGTVTIQKFLVRNSYPHRLLDVGSDEGDGSFATAISFEPSELPIVVFPDGRALRCPALLTLAEELGILESICEEIFDVAVVGSGPAGLAAAVYAASEGLKTVVFDSMAPGGQAGASSRIENYLGFPTGISGQELAHYAQIQAEKFGARFAIPRQVRALGREAATLSIMLDCGRHVISRAVVIATGARYRKLDLANFERFEYQGIHYAATAMEAALCGHTDVVVVGSGNSAGQAALFLAETARRVYLLTRGDLLGETMSDYLVRRISSTSRISVLTQTEISSLDGDLRLRSVSWINRLTGHENISAIENIFVMIGAVPSTGWLSGLVQQDKNGFVCTGSAVESSFVYGTSEPGVFAVGDVRAGSIKRVASAAGEGSAVISEIHRYFAAKPASLVKAAVA